VRKLKAETDLDLSVDGPHLAAQAIRAGLVDEFQLIVGPAIVGGGNRFFPDDVRIDLELLDEHRFRNGVVYLRYGVTDST
jgi:dihydrofolate reductase